MTYTLLTQIIFILLIGIITIYVGWQLYTKGRLYLLEMFAGQVHIVDAINRTLLVGYYLINLGYSVATISTIRHVNSFEELLETVSNRVGIICLVLGGIHFSNLISLYIFGKQTKSLYNSKF